MTREDFIVLVEERLLQYSPDTPVHEKARAVVASLWPWLGAERLMMIECNPMNVNSVKPFHVDSAQHLASKNLSRIVHHGDCLPWVPIWIGYGSPTDIAHKIEELTDILETK